MLEINSDKGQITVKGKSTIELKAGGTSLKLTDNSATLKADNVYDRG